VLVDTFEMMLFVMSVRVCPLSFFKVETMFLVSISDNFRRIPIGFGPKTNPQSWEFFRTVYILSMWDGPIPSQFGPLSLQIHTFQLYEPFFPL
jgi:hypothetical protein